MPLTKISRNRIGLARSVARQSIRSLSQTSQRAGLDPNQGVLVVMLRPHQSHLDPPEQPFGDFMTARFPRCEYHELRPDSTQDDYARLLYQGLAVEQVVIAMIVKPAAWYRFGLLPEQNDFVHELSAKRDCILVSLGSPVALEELS